MNFKEFLLAKGERQMQILLSSRDFTTISLLHEKYTDLLRQYFYVGGMPEAVQEYIDTEGLQSVRRIEVKAEGNVRSNSLSMLLQARRELHAERYSMLPYKEQKSMTNIPLYAV